MTQFYADAREIEVSEVDLCYPVIPKRHCKNSSCHAILRNTNPDQYCGPCQRRVKQVEMEACDPVVPSRPCQNPKCGGPVTGRADKQYCSMKCQRAHLWMRQKQRRREKRVADMPNPVAVENPSR